MLKVIQRWLMDCLGLIIDLDVADFARRASDGVLISQVLQKYDLITTEQLKLVPPCNETAGSLDNYQNHILIWLDILDIKMSETDLDDIVKSRGDAALNLFYEMYVVLHDKNKLHFLTQIRKNEKLRGETPKFEVSPVVESKLKEFVIQPHPLCKPVSQNWDLIRWQMDKQKELVELCEASRHKYLEYLISKQSKKIGYGIVCSCKEKCLCPSKKDKQEKIDYPEEKSEIFTLHELIDQKNKAVDLEEHVPNYCEARNLVNRLHIKQKHAAQSKILKTKLQKELLAKFWNKTIEAQEAQLKDLVSEKILSQSFYEKQMMTKMLQVKHQKEVMKENRQFIENEIMRQKEEEIMHQLFAEGMDSQECMCDYYYERERIRELHRRLYAEKCRLQKERIQKMCRETADHLVDFAIRVGEYKEHYEEDPDRRKHENWAGLFTSCKPILATIKPTEDIVQDLSDLPDEQECEFAIEIDRQDAMDIKDFEKYCNYEWPWELENVSPSEEIMETMENGLNVLGYIVHKMLLAKYPLAPNPPNPDFNFEFAVCVDGLVDVSNVKKLQKLLNLKGIQLLEVQDAVNYCLSAYKKEVHPVIPDDVQSLLELATSKLAKDIEKTSALKKGRKGKESVGKCSESSRSEIVGVKHFENKKHQTPPIFPDEELKLSPAALLGEVAQSTMDAGQPLTDYLISAMVVQYLNSIRDKKGWALINYPCNYFQAMVLEENLSAKHLSKDLEPIKSIVDIADIEERADDTSEEIERRRKSKILPNPTSPSDPGYYETALTAYIKVIKASTSEDDRGEEELPPILNYLDDDADPLDKFYAEQGCNYSMYYQNFDFEAVKYLARLIVGDFTLPRKPSLELFGTAVLFAEKDEITRSKSTQGFKNRAKPKLVIKKERPEKKEKGKKKKGKKEKGKKEKGKKKKSRKDKDSKKSKGKSVKGKKKGKDNKEEDAKTFDNKEVQAPPLEDVYDIVMEEELPDAKPGDERWVYIDFPIPDELQQILGTLCENFEEIYTIDLRQVLFIRRLILNAVVPYVAFTRTHLIDFMNRPDDRQQILHDFQMTFNCLPDHMRQDAEIKAELHCRIDELKQTLKERSDNNLRGSLEERQRLIGQNWMRKQIHELVNMYTMAIQLEADRFVDSVQLLCDYYVAGVTNMPCGEPYFQKEVFKDIGADAVSLTDQLPQVENPFNVQFFHDKMSAKQKKAEGFVEGIKTVGLKVLSATQGKCGPKKGKKTGKPDKGAVAELSQYLMDNYDKIFEEWKAALNGEAERVLLRIQLIKFDCKARIDEMVMKINESLTMIYQEIKMRYYNELKSIDQLCDVVCTAVEHETAVQNELIIERDDFYVIPEILLYPDPPPPEQPPIKEWEREGVFMIEQLEKMYKMFVNTSPTGNMPERCFVFMLQDMLTTKAEDGRAPLVPALWAELTPMELDKVILELFSDAESICWRDFLIYSFMLCMPSDLQLLELRNHFRELDPFLTENVPLSDFVNTKFWFEDQFNPRKEPEMIRMNKIKDLIVRMYMIDDTKVNYSAMLLDFCKGHDPADGFAKAAAMVLGRRVCWDQHAGRTFVRNIFKQRMAFEHAKRKRELEMSDNREMAEEITLNIIDCTVHSCDSLKISEVSFEWEGQEAPPPTFSEKDEETECDADCICDLECYCKTSEEFSNIDIGFEEDINPPMDYFLHFDTVLLVEGSALSWCAQVENMSGHSFREVSQQIFEECRNPDFNNDVLAHEFLNHSKFRQMLKKAARFSDKDALSIVKNVLESRKE